MLKIKELQILGIYCAFSLFEAMDHPLWKGDFNAGRIETVFGFFHDIKMGVPKILVFRPKP